VNIILKNNFFKIKSNINCIHNLQFTILDKDEHVLSANNNKFNFHFSIVTLLHFVGITLTVKVVTDNITDK